MNENDKKEHLNEHEILFEHKEPIFKFYVLNYDHNAKKVDAFNIFDNLKVYRRTIEEVERYCKQKDEYKYVRHGLNHTDTFCGFEAFTECLDKIILCEEWSRREYEISVADAFENDLSKFEKWDCYQQAHPNMELIAREVIRSYKENKENRK